MKLIKSLIVVLFSIATFQAIASQTIIINEPNGGQKVCIIQGGYVVCY